MQHSRGVAERRCWSWIACKAQGDRHACVQDGPVNPSGGESTLVNKPLRMQQRCCMRSQLRRLTAAVDKINRHPTAPPPSTSPIYIMLSYVGPSFCMDTTPVQQQRCRTSTQGTLAQILSPAICTSSVRDQPSCTLTIDNRGSFQAARCETSNRCVCSNYYQQCSCAPLPIAAHVQTARRGSLLQTHPTHLCPVAQQQCVGGTVVTAAEGVVLAGDLE